MAEELDTLTTSFGRLAMADDDSYLVRYITSLVAGSGGRDSDTGKLLSDIAALLQGSPPGAPFTPTTATFLSDEAKLGWLYNPDFEAGEYSEHEDRLDLLTKTMAGVSRRSSNAGPMRKPRVVGRGPRVLISGLKLESMPPRSDTVPSTSAVFSLEQLIEARLHHLILNWQKSLRNRNGTTE